MKMHLASIAVFQILLQGTLLAADWPTAKPEDVGLSTQRLTRIKPVLKPFVDDGKLPCAVTIVARKGKVVYADMIGYQDVKTKKPVREDTIFRMASQTKPVTGVAVMILYEEGKFLLDDPISKYLPEFENMKVMIYKDTGELEDAEPIRVKHLLTHTAGLTYGFNRSADPVAQMYMDAGVVAVGYDCEAASLEDWAKRLARQPLIAQPGTRWHYSVAMDLLGRLVEVWSGKPFDVFMRERIFRPLKMHDTAFYAPQEKHDRLATIYRLNEDGQMEVEPQLNKGWRHPPKFPMGGSGLVSTPRDFYRFAQMLVNGGELDGIRVLSPRIVKLMTSDHLPYSTGANPLSGARQVFGDVDDDSDPLDRGVGFGFTGSVLVNQTRTNTIGSPGRFGWGGAAGTVFRVDPQEEMVVLFFTQVMGPKYKLRKRLEVLVNQAIVE